jgi:hypothetical protein
LNSIPGHVVGKEGRSCKDQSNQGDANTNINYRFTPLYEDGKSAWEIQPKSSRVLAAFTGTHEQQESMGIWGAAQEEAFEKIKEELVKPTVLAMYDLAAQTKICANPLRMVWVLCYSSTVSEQQIWKPVAFCLKVARRNQKELFPD